MKEVNELYFKHNKYCAVVASITNTVMPSTYELLNDRSFLYTICLILQKSDDNGTIITIALLKMT